MRALINFPLTFPDISGNFNLPNPQIMKKQILSLAFIALAISSFSQYDPYLIAGPDTLHVLPAADTAIFNVDSNIDWIVEIDENDTWLSLLEVTDTTFYVRYDDNLSDTSRIAFIHVNADGLTDSVTLIQEAPYLNIESCDVTYWACGKWDYTFHITNPESINLQPMADLMIFFIDANVIWTVETDKNDSWLEIIEITESTFSVQYEDNISDYSRTAVIVIKGGGYTVNVALNQEAPYLNVYPDDNIMLVCSPTLDGDYGMFSMETNVRWAMSDSDTWFYNFYWDCDYNNKAIIRIGVRELNNGYNPRYGFIKISTDLGLSDTVYVTQDFCYLDVEPDTLNFAYETGEQQKIFNLSKIYYESAPPTYEIYSEAYDWLSIVPFDFCEYELPSEFTLTTIEKNLSGQERSGLIIFSCAIAACRNGCAPFLMYDTIYVSQASGYPPLPSGWAVNPADFANSGQITAGVILDLDTVHNGYLGAFVGEECRGYIESTYFPPSDHYVFDLLIYSDSTSGEYINFKYCDTIADIIYDLHEQVEFEQNMILGNALDPYYLHYYPEFKRTFVPGWNWFSVNILQEDMSIGNILSSEMLPLDYIKNQTQSATYYEDYGWFGSLEEIDPTKLHLAKFESGNSINYSGTSVNLDTTTIKLVPGWNWIGYLSKVALPIEEALGSLSASELDYIKNQTGSSTYYDATGWFGNLTELSPGDGFMLRIAHADTLKYPSGSGFSKKSASVVTDRNGLNPHVFEYNGSLTARVFMDGIPAGSSNDLLYAFVGEEIRGIERGTYFEPTGNYLFPLMVYSNITEGETVTFIYYSSTDNRYYNCQENIAFRRDMVVANAFNTFDLHINGPVGYSYPKILDGPSLSVYPNPFHDILNIDYTVDEATNIYLSIYDIYGKMIKLLKAGPLSPGSYSAEWMASGMPSGTYIIRMDTDKTQLMKRVVLIK